MRNISRIEELVKEFEGLKGDERIYWILRILDQLKVVDLQILVREITTRYLTPSGPRSESDENGLGVREPKNPKLPAASAQRTFDEL